MAWRDILAIPWHHRIGLEDLHDRGVFGFVTDARREYRQMEGFHGVQAAVLMAASKKNKPKPMPHFHKLFPHIDKMMRRGVSRAAMQMDRFRRGKG